MLLTEQEYQERLSHLGHIKVNFALEPSSLTVYIILAQLAEIQTKRTRVRDAMVEAISNRAEARMIFEDAKTELDMQMDNLLAMDDNVKAQKTSEMRTSLASTKCADLALKKHHALLSSIQADRYFDTIQEIAIDLKTAAETVSQQIGLLQFSHDAGLPSIDNFSKNP